MKGRIFLNFLREISRYFAQCGPKTKIDLLRFPFSEYFMNILRLRFCLLFILGWNGS